MHLLLDVYIYIFNNNTSNVYKCDNKYTITQWYNYTIIHNYTLYIYIHTCTYCQYMYVDLTMTFLSMWKQFSSSCHMKVCVCIYIYIYYIHDLVYSMEGHFFWMGWTSKCSHPWCVGTITIRWQRPSTRLSILVFQIHILFIQSCMYVIYIYIYMIYTNIKTTNAPIPNIPMIPHLQI